MRKAWDRKYKLTKKETEPILRKIEYFVDVLYKQMERHTIFWNEKFLI